MIRVKTAEPNVIIKLNIWKKSALNRIQSLKITLKKQLLDFGQFVVVQAVEPDVQVGIVDLLVVAGAVAGTHLSIHI